MKSAKTFIDIKRRKVGHTRGDGQSRALTVEDVRVATRRLPWSRKFKDLQDLLIVVLMGDGLSRASELLPFRVHDVKVESNSTGNFCIHSSKTDHQERDDADQFLGAPTMHLYKRYVRRGIRFPTDSLIQPCTKSGRLSGKGIGYTGLNRIIKGMALDVLGLNGRVSTHALRIGTSQSLAVRGPSETVLINTG